MTDLGERSEKAWGKQTEGQKSGKAECRSMKELSRQYDFIFSFMPTFFFLDYFTLSHVTLLSHGFRV